MDRSQLPDISGLLVTPDNPARDDLRGMDYERCAALHNYLVHYAWLADGRLPATLNNNSTTFFTAYGTEAETLHPRLRPSLAAFLNTAIEPPTGDDPFNPPPPFFIFAWRLATPDILFGESIADLQDQPVDSLVRLYSVDGLSADDNSGSVLYHQHFHRVSVFMHIDAYDHALPVKEHLELWHPLETLLSNWIELIQLGKVVASPSNEPALFSIEKVGPWEWRPYSEAQVTACVSAWDQLCEAIVARMPTRPTTITNMEEPEPLVAPAVLDTASVHYSCFARSFLACARRPPFHYIAPGLLLPPADSAGFVAAQPFRKWAPSQHAIPPICLFPADTGDRRPVSLTKTTNPFFSRFFGETEDPYTTAPREYIPPHVPAGLYSNSVDRDLYDSAEEGFRLLLPFIFNNDRCRDKSKGARKSDGDHIDWESVSDLFQHGFKPFGGGYYRTQRLERLLGHWRKLVDEGVWSVGPEGVEGTIDTFKDADSARWRDYYIPPTW